jgi:hypothetical protein
MYLMVCLLDDTQLLQALPARGVAGSQPLFTKNSATPGVLTMVEEDYNELGSRLLGTNVPPE